jgi:hypothetical protein
MIQIEKVSEELFDKIRSRFEKVSIGDENAKTVLDPEKARFFNFDYVDNGKNYGNITISLVDSQSLKIYFDKDIEAGMPEPIKENWYNFLRSIRKFAKRNMIQSFDVRDIAKSGLDIKDLKHANRDAEIQTSKEVDNVLESRLYGTRRSSYQNYPDRVRIIARHSKPIVDETKPGVRSRNIQAFYIENSLGERVRCPEGTTFNEARALARHIKNGGQLHDDFGQHMCKMINEMKALKTFVRHMRGRKFEDVTTTQMVEAAIDHYGKLHRDLFTLRGQRGYEQYKSLWQPENLEEDDIDIESIKELFVKKVFDDRLTKALPIIHREYNKRVNEVTQEFASWADSLIEDDTDGEYSPFANSGRATDSNDNALDDDSESEVLAELFNKNGFEWRFNNGVYYFESKEEVERAKDIIAAFDMDMPFPQFGVYDYGYGTYGSTTFDRELPSHSVSEDVSLHLLKQLSGITK